MLMIMGGTCFQWAKGILANPTAEALASDARIIPPPNCGWMMVNFISPAIKPQMNIVINARDGVLKRTANPSAAVPHQKA
jgi:hypothetical protein